MIRRGGLLGVGGAGLVCRGFAASWYQPLGGLGTIARMLEASKLAGTELRPTGAIFEQATARHPPAHPAPAGRAR